MNWLRTTATDPYARALADRHYPREHVGSKFFSPPGAKIVLRTECGRAYWVSLFQLPEFVDHAWPGAWQCSAVRNETSLLSSELITQAVAATVAEWGAPLPGGLITFVDAEATRSRRSSRHEPGWCFLRAGFELLADRTSRGFRVLRLSPERFPMPCEPMRRQASLDLRGAA